MEKITNFLDAFDYVCQVGIVKTNEYLPLEKMQKLGGDERIIFALNHELLHLLKHVHNIEDYGLAGKPTFLFKSAFVALGDDQIAESKRVVKKSLLKIVINVLSICNTVGLTRDDLMLIATPSDHEIMEITLSQASDQIPNFKQSVSYFISELAVLLERAGHTNVIDTQRVVALVTYLYMSMLYWFDCPWLKDFLAQIPETI